MGLFTSGLGAHLTWTLPFGLLIMFAVFNRFDPRYEEAATLADLPASSSCRSSCPRYFGFTPVVGQSPARPRRSARSTPCRSISGLDHHRHHPDITRSANHLGGVAS